MADAKSEIRDRIDLADLISSHVRLIRTGKTLKGLCPFHEEKTPSFQVNPEKGLWHCFGCGVHGDCFDFVMRTESVGFAEALQKLADKAGVKLDTKPVRGPSPDQKEEMLRALSAAADYYQACLGKAKGAQDYLKTRGLDELAVQTYGIGFAPPGWDYLVNHLQKSGVSLEAAEKAGLLAKKNSGSGYYDRFRNRLMFPVWDGGNTICGFGGRDMGTDGPKYLNSPETPVFRKSSLLYGMNLARKSMSDQGTAVIVEGFMDVISSHRAGITNAVACMGTAFGESHAAILKRTAEKCVVCLDSDSAGQRAALAACDTLETAGLDVRVAKLPPGDDPDSLVNSGRQDLLLKAIEAAVPAAEHRLDTILAAHNLSDDRDRSAALARASKVVAAVKNTFEQDRLIKKLVPYHADFARGSGYDRGLDAAEERIRSAIKQISAPAGRVKTTPAANNKNGRLISPSRRLSALEKAERELLGCLLEGGDTAAFVAGRIRPEDFVSDLARELASEVFTRMDIGEAMDFTGDGREALDTSVARLASELIVRGDRPPLSENALLDCVDLVLDQRKARELAELQQRVKLGLLSKEDNDYQRYLNLMRERHG